MSTYVRYVLEDGTELLVETGDDQSGIQKASRDEAGNEIVPADKKFTEALAGVKSSVMAFRKELATLEMDEVEVTFGIKVVTSGGLFAVVKASAEVNYTVTLKWKNPAE
jgi:hypothetical protein